MASVGTDPSRQFLIQLAARLRGSTRGWPTVPSVGLPAANQFPRDLDPWL